MAWPKKRNLKPKIVGTDSILGEIRSASAIGNAMTKPENRYGKQTRGPWPKTKHLYQLAFRVVEVLTMDNETNEAICLVRSVDTMLTEALLVKSCENPGWVQRRTQISILENEVYRYYVACVALSDYTSMHTWVGRTDPIPWVHPKTREAALKTYRVKGRRPYFFALKHTEMVNSNCYTAYDLVCWITWTFYNVNWVYDNDARSYIVKVFENKVSTLPQCEMQSIAESKKQVEKIMQQIIPEIIERKLEFHQYAFGKMKAERFKLVFRALLDVMNIPKNKWWIYTSSEFRSENFYKLEKYFPIKKLLQLEEDDINELESIVKTDPLVFILHDVYFNDIRFDMDLRQATAALYAKDRKVPAEVMCRVVQVYREMTHSISLGVPESLWFEQDPVLRLLRLERHIEYIDNAACGRKQFRPTSYIQNYQDFITIIVRTHKLLISIAKTKKHVEVFNEKDGKLNKTFSRIIKHPGIWCVDHGGDLLREDRVQKSWNRIVLLSSTAIYSRPELITMFSKCHIYHDCDPAIVIIADVHRASLFTLRNLLARLPSFLSKYLVTSVVFVGDKQRIILDSMAIFNVSDFHCEVKWSYEKFFPPKTDLSGLVNGNLINIYTILNQAVMIRPHNFLKSAIVSFAKNKKPSNYVIAVPQNWHPDDYAMMFNQDERDMFTQCREAIPNFVIEQICEFQTLHELITLEIPCEYVVAIIDDFYYASLSILFYASKKLILLCNEKELSIIQAHLSQN